MRTTLLLLIFGVIYLSSCKKKDSTNNQETQNATTGSTPTTQYATPTFSIVAADFTGTGTSFTYSGTPMVKVTYNNSVIDTMSLIVTSKNYTLKPASTCQYFDGSFAMRIRSIKVNKAGHNFLEFYDNSGLLGKIELDENGLIYSVGYTNNVQTQLFSCGQNGQCGFYGL